MPCRRVRFAPLLLAVILPDAAQAAKKRVAVLELSNPAGLAVQEAEYLTDAVRLEAQRSLPSDTFQLMTRENILEYLPPGKTLVSWL